MLIPTRSSLASTPAYVQRVPNWAEHVSTISYQWSNMAMIFESFLECNGEERWNGNSVAPTTACLVVWINRGVFQEPLRRLSKHVSLRVSIWVPLSFDVGIIQLGGNVGSGLQLQARHQLVLGVGYHF